MVLYLGRKHCGLLNRTNWRRRRGRRRTPAWNGHERCRAAVGPTAIPGMAAAVEDARTERVMASYRQLPSLAVNPDKPSRFAASTDDPDSFTNGASPLKWRPRVHHKQVNAASAPARPNSGALWPISSSDSFVSTALMSVVAPQ